MFRLRPNTSTQPQTTAHLAQTMTLLSLSTTELLQHVESELAKNPALELTEERRCPTCNRPLRGPRCAACSLPPGAGDEEPIVFVSTRADTSFAGARPGEDLPDDNFSPATDDLPTYVLRQIAPDLDPEDRSLAVHLLTSLDEDGLLPVPLLDIARYHHTSLQRVNVVRRLIQFAEPVGVCSTNTQEALLVQLEALQEYRQVPELTDRAIQEGFEHLSHRRYGKLGRLLGISSQEAKRIARFIGENLNPYPARAHWGDVHQGQEPAPAQYHRPDIIISNQPMDPDASLVVEILMPISGTLRVNPMFRKALKRAPKEKAERWKSDLENANLLVKCLRQRNHTIVRLMRLIAHIQRRFILEGDRWLKPLTRAELSEVLDVHESTVSRAVANKCTQLPSGKIIPLSQFFDRSLAVRATLRDIIADETKPLSDTQLAKMLEAEGHPVARRTVAKYRSMEGILPAHLRRKLAAATAL